MVRDNSWGRESLRITGVFASLWFGLALSALIFLWGIDAFGGPDGSMGAAIMLVITLIATYLFATFAGLIVASVGGVRSASTMGTREDAVKAAGVGGAAGYLALILTLTVTLALGFAIAMPGSDGEADAGEDFSAETGTPDPALLGKLLLALVPSGVVGALTAALLAPPAATAREEPQQPRPQATFEPEG